MSSSTELFTVVPPTEALAKWLEAYVPHPRVERIRIEGALGRVVTHDIISPENLPGFARSVVDGFAVRARDTFGASPGLPALLKIIGEAPMGRMVQIAIQEGEAIRVHTGSMIPSDADAVVMVENTLEDQILSSSFPVKQIEILRAVAPGDNVLHIGEDVYAGDRVLRTGHRIRPQDIGGLAALGITLIDVVARPRVGIISTGDEVVPADATPSIGQVRDVNSPALSALVQQHCGEAVLYGIVRDARDPLEATAQRAKRECDIVVISAGSSVSDRDLSAEVIASLGAPGVLVHGIAIKPGKPTILAMADGVPVIGLPGNPVSAMVVAEQFLVPVLCRCMGAQPRANPIQKARISRNVPSTTGREDYIQTRLEIRNGECWAVPVLGKSNLIHTMVHAQGTVRIALNSNGLQQGDWVDVLLAD